MLTDAADALPGCRWSHTDDVLLASYVLFEPSAIPDDRGPGPWVPCSVQQGELRGGSII